MGGVGQFYKVEVRRLRSFRTGTRQLGHEGGFELQTGGEKARVAGRRTRSKDVLQLSRVKLTDRYNFIGQTYGKRAEGEKYRNS